VSPTQTIEIRLIGERMDARHLIINDFSTKRKLSTQSLGQVAVDLGKTVDALKELPEKSPSEGSDVQTPRQNISSRLLAQMASISEMTKLEAQLNEDERKALAKCEDDSKASPERARLVDLDKQVASSRASGDMKKLSETLYVENLASGHLFFRAAVEIVLPTLLAVISVAVCLWRSHCFLAVSSALTKL